MPEQQINPKQALTVLDQTVAVANASRQQHDNCRVCVKVMSELIDEWAVLKSQAAEREETEENLSPATMVDEIKPPSL